jgi:GNAT superfamily N-acetyltransferase
MKITLRPAQPHDKAAITALAAKIWEGEDYLHHNFDNWVAQERGRFVVAYAGDTLIGCNKLTELRPGEWWMEGLRVDPDWRGKGVARLLHENIMRIADEIAAAEKLTGNVRLATESRNYAVHKLALDTGFSHASSYLLHRADIAPVVDSEPFPFIPVQPSEKPLVEEWFDRSAYFAACQGLFEDSWKWYEIRPRLDELLQNGRIFWWRKENENANWHANGLIIIHHRDPQTMVLNYLDTPDGQWAELMDDVRLLGRTYNVTQIKSKPLATDEIRHARPNITWEIDYDLEMWVFQRPIG